MFVLTLSFIIALIIIVFAVQNAAAVPVQFFLWSAKIPLVLVIFCSVFAGFLLMYCFSLWRGLKKKKGNRINPASPEQVNSGNNPVKEAGDKSNGPAEVK